MAHAERMIDVLVACADECEVPCMNLTSLFPTGMINGFLCINDSCLLPSDETVYLHGCETYLR